MGGPRCSNLTSSTLKPWYKSICVSCMCLSSREGKSILKMILQRNLVTYMEKSRRLRTTSKKYLRFAVNFIFIHFYSAFLIEKNKELFYENDIIEKQAAEYEQKFAMTKQLSTTALDEKQNIEKQLETATKYAQDLEQQNRLLIEQLQEQRDEFNESQDRASRYSSDKKSLKYVSYNEFQELQRMFEDKKNKLSETESVLETATLRFEQELKRSQKVQLENLKYQNAIKDLNMQLEQFQLVLNDKDEELNELEGKCKSLEEELNKRQMKKKLRSYSRPQNIFGNNPLLANAIELGKQKSQMSSNEDSISIPRAHQDSFGKQYRLSQAEVAVNITPFYQNVHSLKILSEMEDFKHEISHKRKASCPQIVQSPENPDSYQIYDQTFQSPIERNSSLKTSKRRFNKPPSFYPFTAITEEVSKKKEEKLSQSIMYETIYKRVDTKQAIARFQRLQKDEVMSPLRKQIQQEIEKGENQILDAQEEEEAAPVQQLEGQEGSDDSQSQSQEHNEFASLENDEEEQNQNLRPVSILNLEDELNYDIFKNRDSMAVRDELDPLYSNFVSFAHEPITRQGTLQLQERTPTRKETEGERAYNFLIASSIKGEQIKTLDQEDEGKEQGEEPKRKQAIKEKEAPKPQVENKEKQSQPSQPIAKPKPEKTQQVIAPVAPLTASSNKEIISQEITQKEEISVKLLNPKNSMIQKQAEISEFHIEKSIEANNFKLQPLETPKFNEVQQKSMAYSEQKQISSQILYGAEETSASNLETKLRTEEGTPLRRAQDKGEQNKQQIINNADKESNHSKKVTQDTYLVEDRSQQIQISQIENFSDAKGKPSFISQHMQTQSIQSNNFETMQKGSVILSPSQYAKIVHVRGFSSAQSPVKRDTSSDGISDSRATQQIREDPHKEFFLMTLLSYKLTHKEIEKILNIDGKDMYAQALSSGIPFFEWPKWIEKKLDRIYLDYMYRKKQTTAKQQSTNPLHGHIISVKVLATYEIIPTYFR